MSEKFSSDWKPDQQGIADLLMGKVTAVAFEGDSDVIILHYEDGRVISLTPGGFEAEGVIVEKH